MYEADLSLLCCPHSKGALSIETVTTRGDGGEILEGVLRAGERRYPIRRGIPRFVDDVSHNPTWDYKWRVLDGGRGLNYRILDRTDPAYSIHDIYDRNDHGGDAFNHMHGRLALDLGCGVGQYAVKSLTEKHAAKVVAIDLTGGVDVFRTIVETRYPELLPRLLIVQGDILALPLRDASFDYVYSLGVLMHTGRTLEALSRACGLVKDGGEINVWLYGSEPLAYDAIEPGRESVLNLFSAGAFLHRQLWPMRFIHWFRRIPHDRAVAIVKVFSSDFMYRLARRGGFRWLGRLFPTVDHPDRAYRLINNYDGYINNWCDTWSEHEVFPVLRRHSIAVLGIGTWRLGVWGRKLPGFYAPAGKAQP